MVTPLGDRRLAVARGPETACSSRPLKGTTLGAVDAACDTLTADWDPTPAARLREETEAALVAHPAAIAVTSPAGVRRWISEAGPLRPGLMAALHRLPVVSHRHDAVEACASAGVAAQLVGAESEEELPFHLDRVYGESLVLETARWAAPNDVAVRTGDTPTCLVQPYRYRLPSDLTESTRLVQMLIADDIDGIVFTSPASVAGLFEVAAECGVSTVLSDALSRQMTVAATDRPTAAAAEQCGAFVSRCPLRTDGRDLLAMLSTLVDRPLLPARVLPAGVVEAEGRRVELSPLELRLFAALNRRQGIVCPRGVLAEEVWGHHSHGDRLLSLTSRLRRRITPLGLTVEAVQRRGYRLRRARS